MIKQANVRVFRVKEVKSISFFPVDTIGVETI